MEEAIELLEQEAIFAAADEWIVTDRTYLGEVDLTDVDGEWVDRLNLQRDIEMAWNVSAG